MEKLTVAIAEDNELMLGLLEDIVANDKELNVVGTARNGEDIYKIIKEEEPDVVLLDIVMPKLDGLGVLDKVNQDRNIKKQPTFIMVSAIGQDRVTEDAFNLGADYYIMKPFDENLIISRIKRAKKESADKKQEVMPAFSVKVDKKVEKTEEDLETVFRNLEVFRKQLPGMGAAMEGREDKGVHSDVLCGAPWHDN